MTNKDTIRFNKINKVAIGFNKTNEQIIKQLIPDWSNWNENCKKQVLEAMGIALKQYRWQGYRSAFGEKVWFKSIPWNQFNKTDWDKINYNEYTDTQL